MTMVYRRNGEVWFGHFSSEECRAMRALREHCATVVEHERTLRESPDALLYLAANPDTDKRIAKSARAAQELLEAIDGLGIPSEQAMAAVESVLDALEPDSLERKGVVLQ